jgi:hypothetical protein
MENDQYWQKRNLINLHDADLDKAIYRIMKMEHLVDMFSSKQLVIPRVNSWIKDDPYENFFLQSDFRYGDLKVSGKEQSEFIYGQCWSCFKDSDALWRIYSPQKQHVRVKTTIRKLFNAIYLDDINMSTSYVGLVKYQPKKDLIKWVKGQSVSMSSIQRILIDSLFMRISS